ncbi:MAG: DUF2304 domain-containing protein [Candidatus Eisenbacteria bacterium]|uniref:DUF2304 domain-containing protein n=1 Tax=Eiseniibacteriota bacterium TaxID=2212470 RepID=A0A956SF52_UNCEI|nr:DUF2304 domain-containing protein [Candidatus Eisenbacteria bacterium]MCB9462894.1 DUF2304 domain-containing protein [Candidatus Eisenbacteria bacterium]
MTLEARLFVALLGMLFLLIVLRSLRSHRMQFEYSLVWICLSLVLILAAVFQKTADRIAKWVGIDYPPAFFFLVCFFVVLVMLFQISLRLSVLSDRIRRLAQETAVAGALQSVRGEGGQDGQSGARVESGTTPDAPVESEDR